MRFFIRSYGCSSNLADSQTITGCLLSAGYEQVKSIEDADIVIYNTCAVKGPTENRIISALKKIPENKKIIISGCLPLINFARLKKEIIFNGVIGPAPGEKIINLVQRIAQGEKIIEIDRNLDSKPDLCLPNKKTNPIISVIPINYGCLGSCSYCCVVFARGKLISYPIKDIIKRLENDLKKEIKEIWLTSQDIGCYGLDIGTNLIELLQSVLEIKDDFKIRLGMMNPNRVYSILDDLVNLFKNPKLFKFIHIPVQSGDDEVLLKMNRLYTASQFTKIIKAFRNSIPTITYATDVICGFPGETTQAFENTLKLIKNTQPDIVNVSKFFGRPKTKAKEMKENLVDMAEINRRSKIAALTSKQVSFQCNKKWVNWSGDILIDEKGKLSGSWIGRNYAYKPIVIKNSEYILGKTIKVKVTKAFPTYLSAKIC
jgi:MiaB-like tRNA modifying enzyme